MKWLFRPSILVLVSAALAVGATALVVGPVWQGGRANRAVRRAVPEGDREIAWLNPATSATTWERFVTAVRRAQADCPDLDLQVDDANAFPAQTTAVPELVLSLPGHGGRLWVRWYKLTADLKIHDWAVALTQEARPPLAIIGGGSSDRARDLAQELRDAAATPGPAPPLFLITTATADEVAAPDDPARSQPLGAIYAGRTFRFCFTNRQMAEAVADFVWSRDDLRPDSGPAYLPTWKDDPYSEDLADRFKEVLWDRFHRDAVSCATRAWLALTARVLGSGFPPGLGCEGMYGDRAGYSDPFWGWRIPYSVGTFGRPNRKEAEAAEMLMDTLGQHPGQRLALLVLPATAQPARRFLRGLLRIAPSEADRFVVVTGDSIDFNTVYRDRNLTWAIQDQPFTLVFFCHRNPVDPAAFRPESGRAVPDARGPGSSGTEDLLLFADIAETVVRSAYRDGRLADGPDDLAANLRAATPHQFDAEGNRPSGTGEYVVYLQPRRAGDRILPEAILRVYRAEPGEVLRWSLVRELPVEYSPGRAGEGGTERGAP